MKIFKRRQSLDSLFLKYMNENNKILAEVSRQHKEIIKYNNDLADQVIELAKSHNKLLEYVNKMKEERQLSNLN